jgi:tetratricopeptide (TPR) repeat protein
MRTVAHNSGITADLFNARNIRLALKAYHSEDKLAQQQLCQIELVEARRKMENLPQDPRGRALSLRAVLRQAIEALKPENGEADVEAWRHYKILHDQFVLKRSTQAMANQLYIERTSYYNEQNRALDRLSMILSALESTQADTKSGASGADTRQLVLSMPAQGTAIFGRETVLSDLRARLISADRPTLALRGLPGMGKTTLAIELAHDPDVRARFPDGVLWARVGRAPDEMQLLAEWAVALGVAPEVIGQSKTLAHRARVVSQTLADKRMLLIIDDVWQTQHGLTLRTGGTQCGYLFTTRFQTVGIELAGASVMQIPELDIDASLALIAAYAPRALALAPDEIRQLARSVGNLPLAVNLIGRYLGSAAVGDSPARIQRAIRQLNDPARRLGLRHAQDAFERDTPDTGAAPVTLLDTVRSSIDALDAGQRAALQLLSLFPPKPNTFGEDAACAGIGMEADMLDTLADAGIIDVANDRYAIHQVVHDCVATDDSDANSIERLLAHYSRTAAAHADEIVWQLAERENWACAIDRAVALKFAPEKIVPLLWQLLFYFDRMASYAQLANWLGKLDRSALDTASPHTQARYLLMTAVPQLRTSSIAEASATLNLAADAVERCADPDITAQYHNWLAWVTLLQGDADASERNATLGYDIAIEHKLIRQALTCKRLLARIALARGALVESEAHSREALRLAEESGSAYLTTVVLYSLSAVLEARGDTPGAVDASRRGLTLARAIRDDATIALLAGGLGEQLRIKGELAEASQLVDESLASAMRVENAELIGFAQLYQCKIALELSRVDEARRYGEASLGTFASNNQTLHIPTAQMTLAYALMAAGDWQRAEHLGGSALATTKTTSDQAQECEALLLLAKTAHQRGDLTLAKSRLDECIAIAETANVYVFKQAQVWRDSVTLS